MKRSILQSVFQVMITLLVIWGILFGLGTLAARIDMAWYITTALAIVLFSLFIFSLVLISKWRKRSEKKRVRTILNSRTLQDDTEFCSSFPEESQQKMAPALRNALAEEYYVAPDQIRHDEPIATFRRKNQTSGLPTVFHNNMAYLLLPADHDFESDPFGLKADRSSALESMAFIIGGRWWVEQIDHLSKSDDFDLACFINFIDKVAERISGVFKEPDDVQN